MKDSFYITIDSHSTNEFSNNENGHFRKRIANTLQLDDGPWYVGMTCISIPDADQPFIPLNGLPDDATLVTFHWTELQPTGSSENIVSRNLQLKKSQLDNKHTNKDIMKAVINGYEYSKVAQMKDSASNFSSDSTQYPGLDHTALLFDWQKNGDLIWNNDTTSLGQLSPRLVFNLNFAIQMGFVTKIHDGSQHLWELGPYLKYTVLKHGGRDRKAWDLHNEWIDKNWGSRSPTSY